MLRKRISFLALLLLCGVGQACVLAVADEPIKTGEKRDTLLYVRTDPPGAKVFLNGKELGITNGLFRVEPGRSKIFLELEGQKTDEKQVTIQANGVTRVELELKPQNTTASKAIEDAVTTISRCSESDPRVEQAMQSLRSLEQSKVVTGLIPYLSSSQATIRRSAIYILWNGKFADITPAVATLEKLLGHEEFFTRGMAALALGQNRVASSYDALAKMTASDSSGYARRCAAMALGWLGDQRAKSVLETALKDSDPLVRINASAALDILHTKQPSLGPSGGSADKMPVTTGKHAESEQKAAASGTTDGAHFIARLPQGTVELVGLTNYPPTKQSPWWRPDGSPAHIGPYFPKPSNFSLSPDRRPVTFLVRCKDFPLGASHLAWRIAGHWNGTAVADAEGDTILGCGMLSVEVGDALTTSLRAGISTGAWDTVVSQPARSLHASSFSRDGQSWTVTFDSAAAGQSDRTMRVRLTSTVPYGRWDTRLAAITSDGGELTTSIGYMNAKGTADFDVPLPSIREFRFQIRPYQWIEFKNISLRPGQKSDVMVIWRDASASVSPATTAEPKKIPFVLGATSFKQGDSITITEVKATSPEPKIGDKVIVKGHYTLASEPAAMLGLFMTATSGSGRSATRPEQRMAITNGQGDFELAKTLDCEGDLHVSLYPASGGGSIGGVYFASAKQTEQMKHSNGITGVELERNPQAEAKTGAKADGAQFIAHLPQGTVELLGVTKYPPSAQSKWWKPDGSAVEVGPYLMQPTSWSTPRGKALAFLLRYRDLPRSSRGPVHDIEPCTGNWWGTIGVLDARGKTVPDCQMFCAEFEESTLAASLRIRIPNRRVEFQNVSLGFGQKTEVKVISSEKMTSPGGEQATKPDTAAGQQSQASEAKAIVEGVGWGGFRVGATREGLINEFGPLEPNPSPNSKWTGWYSKYHVDCWFDQQGRAVELRFNKGFMWPLTSGIRIGSSEKEVLSAYGAPDRVVRKPQAKMLEYTARGVLLWISNGMVLDFTVMKPSASQGQDKQK